MLNVLVQLSFAKELDESPAFLLSFKAQNTLYKFRTRSSNIIHHPVGRSELRDAVMSLRGF